MWVDKIQQSTRRYWNIGSNLDIKTNLTEVADAKWLVYRNVKNGRNKVQKVKFKLKLKTEKLKKKMKHKFQDKFIGLIDLNQARETKIKKEEKKKL